MVDVRVLVVAAGRSDFPVARTAEAIASGAAGVVMTLDNVNRAREVAAHPAAPAVSTTR